MSAANAAAFDAEGEHLRNPANDAKAVQVMKGKGCERCNGTGYKGRVGLYEVMEVGDEVRELILSGASAVVVAAGYETGPGNLSHVGGTPEETHFYLGTGHLDEMTLGIGGCAANAGIDLAKLGASAAVVGRVGEDGFGVFVRLKDDAQVTGFIRPRDWSWSRRIFDIADTPPRDEAEPEP